MGIIPHDLVKFFIIPRTNEIGSIIPYHLSCYMPLENKKSSMDSIVRFPRFEVYVISLMSSPTLHLKGLTVLHMQVPPFKGALQCTSRHSRLCWSNGSEILIVSESPHGQCLLEESICVKIQIQVSI